LRLRGTSARGAGGGANSQSYDSPQVALHWVRGHYKEYGEKGLFGKRKGVFWWSPHLAGDKRAGIVTKDYSLDE